MILDEEALKQINGGAALSKILIGIGIFFTMIVGIADGYTRPLRCS